MRFMKVESAVVKSFMLQAKKFVICSMAYSNDCIFIFQNHHVVSPSNGFLSKLKSFYLVGLCLVAVYTTFVHSFTPFADRLPFLPLMMLSVYCSVGLIYSWISMYCRFLSS